MAEKGRPTVDVVGYLSLDRIELAGDRTVTAPGGAALYAAFGVLAAGGAPRLHARCGRDFPTAALDELARLGVDVAGVVPSSEPGRRATLVYDQDGRRRPDRPDDAWWTQTERLLPPAPRDDAEAVLLCPMPVPHLAKLLDDRHGDRRPCVADTSEAYAARDPAALLSAIGRLSLFAPSLSETRLLCPGRSDDEALAELACRVPVVVQKRGADGLVLARRDRPPLRAPAPAVRVVDPTGAGDAAVGAMAVALALGLGDDALLRLAGDVAARAVAGTGSLGLLLYVTGHSD